ncbi:MAG TPA: acetyl-CoA carboxylase biotin carboxyl carrier protein subunit [Candidatus Limnocylindrales bacterium]|nr:acetyl-CoA carboxylase biotin carboxyl carrier protein subunit [Candidatus Limnocylindrales bacterium]
MSRALRLTVEAPEPLVVEIEPDDLGREDGHRPRGTVRALPLEPEDRARGALRREVVVDGWRFEVVVEDAARAALRERAGRLGGGPGRHQAQVVTAQIPGRVLRVEVAQGDPVEPGQRLLSIEAMKMENELRATVVGTVARVAVAPGETVERGQELVVIA